MAFLTLGGLVFFSFPFLWDEKIYFEELFLDEGKVLIVSDLHLESNPRNLTCIGDYLKENDISYFIINGDLFDKMHNEEFKEEFLKEGKERLAIEKNPPYNIIYILALYNHDPYLKVDSGQFAKNGEGSTVLKGALKLKAEEELFYIFHGDYAISYGIGIPALINKLTSNLFFESFTKWAIGAEKEDWIILGHSHIPGIDYEKRVANSGCWINRIVSSTDTAILIEAGEELETEISLIKIPCE